jgi:hypothetical protein
MVKAATENVTLRDFGQQKEEDDDENDDENDASAMDGG